MIVSSLAHERGQMNWDDLNWEKNYSKYTAYGQSKLANVLHAKELANRLEGTGITVYSLHPGSNWSYAFYFLHANAIFLLWVHIELLYLDHFLCLYVILGCSHCPFQIFSQLLAKLFINY